MLYDKFGVLKEPTKLEPTQVFRSNLRFAWDQSGIGTGVSELPKGPSHKGLNAPPSSVAPAEKPAEKDEKH
jgi:hypothetical protein